MNSSWEDANQKRLEELGGGTRVDTGNRGTAIRGIFTFETNRQNGGREPGKFKQERGIIWGDVKIARRVALSGPRGGSQV